MWIIKHIFDGDYGCEERQNKEDPSVLVTLINELGEEKYISKADAWLIKNDLDIGSKWPENL